MNVLHEDYALCNVCNGEIPKDDLVQGMCLWCWANVPDEEREYHYFVEEEGL